MEAVRRTRSPQIGSKEQSLQDEIEPVVTGVRHLKIVFVNAYFVETPENAPGSWVLVDTGLPMTGGRVLKFAEKLYGARTRPAAIVLTHGHFDHAGAALKLAQQWDVPIYAHRLELPYLTGRSDYPPQDPTVGGALAFMSRVFPHSGFDFGDRVRPIAENGQLAELPGWRVIHTPGHTAGHASLFRESDRTLLAGDALATMNQDSWVSTFTEKQEFHRAPSPFTTDWQAARRSVEILAELRPNTVAAGHGQPIKGVETARRFSEFARNFAPPQRGRYVNRPAVTDETGVVRLPPPVADPVPRVMAGVALGVAAGLLFARLKKRRGGRLQALRRAR